ncbi:type II toxin-antitoxin system HicB family antitoxin [uncultured Holdemanella sp.]|uniref:type II toxin-antitoxin system HicB family antitoxin n=1 Tax=uncultured Holdemanella sp. TaxID=1763549 RepID=UPI00258B1E33|nr:type II toxin-antitoxin system HicB family antitoxin [uncultured Holdemanella sp.]
MLSIYPACFFEEENHYSVIFPDFNYLSTCGNYLQDAMEMAVDCLAGALFSAKLDNQDIPIPSKLEEIDPTQIASELEFEFKQSFVTLVSVDVEEYAKTHFNKAIKKNTHNTRMVK